MRRQGSDATALWLALVYAFGTPSFFRTGYLNHNLILGHVILWGFLLIWNPWESPHWTRRTRYFLGGVAAGIAVLLDYSGSVLLLTLFFYGLYRRYAVRPAGQTLGERFPDIFRHGLYFFLGTLGPVFMLWFYQWRSFGNPLLPAVRRRGSGRGRQAALRNLTGREKKAPAQAGRGANATGRGPGSARRQPLDPVPKALTRRRRAPRPGPKTPLV